MIRRRLAEIDRRSPIESDVAKKRIGIVSREYRVFSSNRQEEKLFKQSPTNKDLSNRHHDISELSLLYRSRKRLSLPPIHPIGIMGQKDQSQTERTMSLSPSRLLMQ